MTTSIVITVCTLLLIAYLFDISAALTKVPSVILLLLLGLVVKHGSRLLDINLPELSPLLPVFGTIGLILIVLEGALELELDRSKGPLLKRSLIVAVVPVFVLAFTVAAAFSYLGQVSFKTALVNAIPFCVISSSIAIPSSRNLEAHSREFVVYESSLSDIIGVLFFNFVALHEVIDPRTCGNFIAELLLVIVLSFIAVIALSFLLSRIRYHVTFTPIILFVILIYYVSKIYHLPGLIFILVFGLFLGNLGQLKHYKWMSVFRPGKLDKEVAKFMDVTMEATFFVRALFFILFGFLMDVGEILDLRTLPIAAAITALVFLVRWLILRIARLPSSPLLYVAPRGLITILLFLSITPADVMPLVGRSLLIQVIVLSVAVMMFGLMGARSKEPAPPAVDEPIGDHII